MRFVFGSLHFIANQLGDLSMKETKQPNNLGPRVDWYPLTPVQVSLVSEARPRHGSDVSRGFELDLSGENAGDPKSCHPNMVDQIYNVALLLKSNSEGDREDFMVGQGYPPADQTKEEIT
jgi:hypothetical protein